MAHFIGSVAEFMKFMGPFARNKVMYIAAKHKRNTGKCDECSSTNNLEAAHIAGRERLQIISNILSEFIEDKLLTVDLNYFEERFIEEHSPIERNIRILCRNCHRNYDSKRKQELNMEELTLETRPNAKKLAEEASIIAERVNRNINKAKAMQLSQTQFSIGMNNLNTIFSNINAAQNVWWLEPNNEKFQMPLYIILNNVNTQTLYFFKLPPSTIRNPENLFKQRNDKFRQNCSDIYISVSGTKFVDKQGFDFTEFLVERVSY